MSNEKRAIGVRANEVCLYVEINLYYASIRNNVLAFQDVLALYIEE